MESITLYFKEGSSDKVYQVSIEPTGDKYLVNIAFGRRGATLQTGTKTHVAVEYAAARAIYEAAIKSKKAKGYTVGESGTPFTDATANFTGISCQLLSPVEEAEVDKLVRNDDFAMQQKHDGKRLLIQKQGSRIIGINRRGLECGFPDSIREAAGTLSHDFLVDGEAVGDILHAFDLLELDGQDIRGIPYRDRIAKLLVLLGSSQQTSIQWVIPIMGTLMKRRGLEQLKEDGAEGAVFKDLTAPFSPGRPGTGGSQFKLKFWNTASCVVAHINGKRSVALELCDGFKLVSVGNVTIPPNHAVPEVGAIVEVRYLYAFLGGSLFQPTYLGQRDDVPVAECTLDQLKFKEEPQAA